MFNVAETTFSRFSLSVDVWDDCFGVLFQNGDFSRLFAWLQCRNSVILFDQNQAVKWQL